MDCEKIKTAAELYEKYGTNAVITNLSFKAEYIFGTLPIEKGENLLTYLKNIIDFPIRKQIYTSAELKGVLYPVLVKPIYNGIDVCGYITEFIESKNLIELLGKIDYYHDLQNIFTLLSEKINNLLSMNDLLEEKLTKQFFFDESNLVLRQKDNCKSLILMMTNISEYFSNFFNHESNYIINLTELLENVVTNSNVILVKCNRFIDYSLPKEKMYVRAGQRKLLISLMNGIQNALLYSNNSPEIKLSLRKNNDYAEIEIINDGVKLPKDFFENAGTSPSSHSFGRTGFGLAIIRNYVLSQKGTFSIIPREEGGAALKLTFKIIDDYETPSYLNSTSKDYINDEYSSIKLYLSEFIQ